MVSTPLRSKRCQVWEKTGGRCWYCGEGLPERGWCWDHQDPVAQGGSSLVDNLVPACRRCNSREGNASVEEFRVRMGWFHIGVPVMTDMQLAYVRHLTGVDVTPSRVMFWAERCDDE